ncbi:hypothetical protein J3R82DRAFT_1103 [Butyriboletus roseoflavus]|nr:hypothetical protein J3R82DRAFT_1103 [Butyriboletus roseoflavus]
MPSYTILVLAFALVAAVRAIPVDEISARNGIGSASSGVGGQAAGGSVSTSSSNCTHLMTDCATSYLSGLSLAKVDSENAGNGGSAPSGASSAAALFSLVKGTNSTSKAPVGSAFSGAGGEAPGGSVVDNHPALVELDSDNAGQGGTASSGNSSGLVD